MDGKIILIEQVFYDNRKKYFYDDRKKKYFSVQGNWGLPEFFRNKKERC